MNKIYYYKKEVQLGDEITHNGMMLEVTQNLIDNNPEVFERKEEIFPEYVECYVANGVYKDYFKVGGIYKYYGTYQDMDLIAGREIYKGLNAGIGANYSQHTGFEPSTKEAWLLQETKKRYPKGTKFKNAGSTGGIYISSGEAISWTSNTYPDGIGNGDVEGVVGEGLFYADGQWAEIVKPLFVTEDGVEIFEGDKFYSIIANKIYTLNSLKYSEDKNFMRFSTREAAEEYIAKHKEKTLEDYENELLENKNNYLSVDYSPISRNDLRSDIFYRHLKKYEPRAYYSIVLQLIADDLNEGIHVPDTAPDYTIVNYIDGYKANDWNVTLTGAIIFYSESGAEKAIKIMGDKLDIIYKS